MFLCHCSSKDLDYLDFGMSKPTVDDLTAQQKKSNIYEKVNMNQKQSPEMDKDLA